MIHLTIDGKEISTIEGRTLLEACRENGIDVPTLCYHPALEPYGACRLCVVEILEDRRPSRLVASCTYPCQEGIRVMTHSAAVKKNRRLTAELLLAGAYRTPEIVALAAELGVKEPRYKLPESDSCVLCGLCVRACHEIVGISAISMVNRGISKQVSTPFSRTSANCIACGTCVLICPTGRLSLSDVSGLHIPQHRIPDYLPFYCQLCDDKAQIPSNGSGSAG
ncbi:MAG: 2Fe-2S iron-sulfur cluster-binding protein [Chloroflexota bacterium]|jgi:NADH dehydrogenase/NADH:ubiquinone oxidoreductase subunit G